MTKEQIIKNFDPSQPGLANESIYGLPFDASMSDIIIIPVPWEVTVSYGSGASDGPDAILNASFQVDLHHQEFPDLWKLGMFLDLNEQTDKWKTDSDAYKIKAQEIIFTLENGQDITANTNLKLNQEVINTACQKMVNDVKAQTLFWLNQGKKVGLLGGDHSTPLGYYLALATKHNDFGILHLDAHMDLRIAYEGFTYSHASVMYNALKIPQISTIVQVGIRDFCQQEADTALSERVVVYSDMDLKKETFEGLTWQLQCDKIIGSLPQKVTVSFDIDALYPWYCPNTGTPVPGGFSFEQAAYLLTKLANSGKEIIGFDLVEVAPSDNENDDWDGNVGARMLYHLCGILAKNNGLNVGAKITF